MNLLSLSFPPVSLNQYKLTQQDTKSDAKNSESLAVNTSLLENEFEDSDTTVANLELIPGSTLNQIGEMFLKGDGIETNSHSAIDHFQQGSGLSDANEQYKLGLMYLNGDGVIKNEEMALYWFSIAAKSNHPEAQYQLGWIYFDGIGVFQNIDLTINYFTLAAKQNHINAHLDLAAIYECRGNSEQSFEHFLSAAELGDDEAQFKVGLLYFSQEDLNNAEKWLRIAANKEHPEAQHELAQLLLLSLQGPNQLTVNKKDEIKNEILNWLKKSASKNNIDALRSLGQLYRGDSDIPKNDKQAFCCFQKAVRLGDIDSLYDLGFHYQWGSGVDQSSVNALKCYVEAAAHDHTNAQYRAGEMYYHGNGVEKNYSQAEYWLNIAALKDHKKAKRLLNKMHELRNRKSNKFLNVTLCKKIPCEQNSPHNPPFLISRQDIQPNRPFSNTSSDSPAKPKKS
jgi:TPR repeat protein